MKLLGCAENNWTVWIFASPRPQQNGDALATKDHFDFKNFIVAIRYLSKEEAAGWNCVLPNLGRQVSVGSNLIVLEIPLSYQSGIQETLLAADYLEGGVNRV